MLIRKILILSLLIYLLSPIIVSAEKSSLAGIYSSFRYSDKSGDIVGMEIQLIPNPIGYSAIVQASEGAPAFPEAYRIKASGNTFTLIIPEKSVCGLMPGIYSGTVTKKALILNSPKPLNRKYYLPKGRSFWQ